MLAPWGNVFQGLFCLMQIRIPCSFVPCHAQIGITPFPREWGARRNQKVSLFGKPWKGGKSYQGDLDQQPKVGMILNFLTFIIENHFPHCIFNSLCLCSGSYFSGDICHFLLTPVVDVLELLL